MKKFLFLFLSTLSASAFASYIEAAIPAELASAYMSRAVDIFKKNPEKDVVFLDNGSEQILKFNDIGENFKAMQICVRRKNDGYTSCVVRDFKELGGSTAGGTASLNRLSGILWDLLPVKASDGSWGKKNYKNVSCFVSTWSTGSCTIDIRK